MSADSLRVAIIFLVIGAGSAPIPAAGRDDDARLVAGASLDGTPSSLRPLHFTGQRWSGVWHHHASTPAESFLRGAAQLIRARAEQNLMNAEARIAAAKAHDYELDNRKKQVATYFDVRQANSTARAAERGPRPSADQLAKYARSGRPKPLSPSELNDATGQVTWPIVLLDGKYAEYRRVLDGLFNQRAVQGAIEAIHSAMILDTTDVMLDKLGQQVNQVRPTDYIEAKRFLESLAYAAQPRVD